MKCPKCNMDNSKYAIFCIQCGADLKANPARQFNSSSASKAGRPPVSSGPAGRTYELRAARQERPAYPKKEEPASFDISDDTHEYQSGAEQIELFDESPKRRYYADESEHGPRGRSWGAILLLIFSTLLLIAAIAYLVSVFFPDILDLKSILPAFSTTTARPEASTSPASVTTTPVSTPAAPTPSPGPSPSAAPTPTPTPVQDLADAAIAASNAANSGLFCSAGGYIYYRSSTFKEASGSTYGLYRMKLDGSDVKKIYAGPNWGTCADDKYVYFYDHKDGYRLKRLEPESGKTKYLTDFKVNNCVLLDGFLYCSGTNGFYKVAPSGDTAPAKLASFPVRSVSMSQGVLYFINASNNTLMSLDSAGKQNTVMSEKALAAVAYNGKIYFTPYSGKGLYAYDIATKQKQALSNVKVNELVLDGDTVFFINADSNRHIYSVPIDGGTAKKIYGHRALYMCAAGNWLYFVNTDGDTAAANDTYKLWRVKKDGSQGGEIK